MPAFALDLAPDGIRFLARAGEGWDVLDTVQLDAPDLAQRMAAMRDMAEERAGPGFQTALIIPESVILYTTVDAPHGDSPAREEDVARALEGLTPCPVEEMVFDWRQEGPLLRVAALDVVTLDEAEEFAAGHGLNPVGFTAQPRPEQFPAAPDFGQTKLARARVAAIDPVPEVAAVAEAPEAQPVADATPAPEPKPAPAANTNTTPARNRRPLLTAAGLLGSAAVLIWSVSVLIAPDGGDPATAAIELGPADLPDLPTLAPQSPRDVAAASPAPDLFLVEGPETNAHPTGHTIPAPGAAETPQIAEQTRDIADALPALNAVNVASGPLNPAPTLPQIDDGAPVREARLFAPDASAFGADAELPPPIEYVAVDATQIWQYPAPPATVPADATTDDIYLASIDPEVEIGDAFALTPIERDLGLLSRPGTLPGPGQIFDMDDRGLVRATPDGSLSPEGVVVTEGRPEIVPPTRPESTVPDTSSAIALALAGPRPRGRPDDLIENSERARLGGRTSEELATLRPGERPESEQEAAPVTAPSAQAVAQSRVPSSRPSDFGQRVATIRNRAEEQRQAQQAAQVAAAVASAQPTIPTSASVARQATIDNALNLRRVNLIGVYGSEADRRALIRLSSGRYVKVKVGDRVDGGQVAAIGDSELRLIKGGRNVTLTVPQG
ncbi:MAG: hypothetical protein AAFQ79_15720 [Pseudomonadota bacterium]